MSTLSDAIEKFCLQNSTQPDDALKAVFRDTWVNVMYPQMITNELQGQLLSMISLLARPLQILEIGTFTGYATICLASGLTEGGKITTIEKNAELENRIRRNIETALLTDKTELLIGDAKEIIQQRFSEKAVSFDIIYIDADKENYPVYLSLAYPLLKPGGVMLADNVFWGGKMFDENTKPTKESLGVKKFLSAAAALPWQSRTIIPVGGRARQKNKLRLFDFQTFLICGQKVHLDSEKRNRKLCLRAEVKLTTFVRTENWVTENLF